MTLETLAYSGLIVGLFAYAALTGFFVYGWLRRITGRAALTASLLMTAWFASFAERGPGVGSDLLEVAAYGAWIALLTRILGVTGARLRNPVYRGQVGIVVATAVIIVIAIGSLPFSNNATSTTWSSLLKLLLCLVGIVTLEQVARNTRRDHEWNVKFVIIGLGIVFTYGFALYADALLFTAVNLKLFAPQGWIYSAAVPFLCIASLRNRSHRMNVNLSRRFVFRTGSLVLAGAYLLIMGTAGYYVRFFGGEWGEVFEVFLISAGLIALAVLAVSGKLRSTLREVVVRNLYEYKYDYRDEWLRVTRELTQASPDESLGQRAIHAMTDLLQAKGGSYWRLATEGTLLPMAQLGSGRWNEPLSPAGSRSLIDFFERLDWIIDLDEYRQNPHAYVGLDLAADAELLAPVRFIVPLTIEERLFGIIAIAQPSTAMNLIWEDYDILKIIARQTAAFLALQHADSVLSASKQLRAMDQMSAFVVHDLKTINAQLGLLLRNAERHRNNPAFIDDMLKTTENAVARMTNLVDQLRTSSQPQSSTVLNLGDVVQQAVRERSQQFPPPVFEATDAPIQVMADRERLISVVSHIIQNAQDATPHNGAVRVRVDTSRVWATVTITDSGHGMTTAFIETELFAPFATTKGVAGIGVGAYQCREYVRSLGGDVAVRSQVGVGTEFALRLPLQTVHELEQAS